MMRRMSTILSIAFKRLYPDNFGRALKLMTFVQTGSIHIDGFKNIKKKFKMVSRYDGNEPKCPRRGTKCLHAGKNIPSYRNSAKRNF